MGGALHAGVARAGASFELDRLEKVDGRLVVRGWWFGVRGVRFVRPALIVDDRQILATLEHKPWVAAEDGGWIAAFPWKRRGLDVRGVTLVVAPSIEVPLDRHAEPVEPGRGSGAEGTPVAPMPATAAPELELVCAPSPTTVVEEVREPLRVELAGFERQLDAMRVELRDARDYAAAREERCRELEHAVARERGAATAARDADDELLRSHAMAVLDRDRAMEQHAEAVSDREAAVRARKRMERQRDEALAARSEADARRDEALAERDEVRRQRDELALAHQALRAQLNGSLAEAARNEVRSPAEPAEAARTQTSRPESARPVGSRSKETADAERTGRSRVEESAGAATRTGRPRPEEPMAGARTRASRRKERAVGAPTAPLSAVEPDDGATEKPLGVRTIPAARTIAASLHRSQRERTGGVTRYDMWAIRILGSVAALAFISLLVMILKAFFVF